MTKASLIVPTRGGARRLPVLLDALTHQTEDDFEVIVVLDGDLDGSESVVERHPLPGVRTIVFPENRGRVAALNAGFDSAKGDVLIRCDDDLEPSSDYVARHVAAHEGADVGVVGIYLNVIEDNEYSRAYGAAADERFRQAAYSAGEDTAWLFWAGNCSITRAMWQSVGPYDSRFRAYGWEDADYGRRLKLAGYPIILDRGLETTHHAAATNTEARIRRAYRSGQARQLFDSIHGKDLPGTGPSRPKNDSLWNVTANALSFVLTYERSAFLARMIDRWLLPHAPSAVAGKAIALLVETAAVSGYAKKEKAVNDV